ncbi:MAG: IS200/IS605 family transposase [Phycisphaerae bacterium]
MSHTYSKLVAHCVFSTKGRRSLITSELRPRLHAYLGGIVREQGAHMIACGGTADHVHMFVQLPAGAAIADMMRVVKACSTKWVHETFPSLASFAWQTGYAAFSVSASGVQDVRSYVEEQEVHHRTRTFEEEFVLFLRRHGVDYDERYLWG